MNLAISCFILLWISPVSCFSPLNPVFRKVDFEGIIEFVVVPKYLFTAVVTVCTWQFDATIVGDEAPTYYVSMRGSWGVECA